MELERLQRGEVSAHERRARMLRPVLGVAGALVVPLFVLGALIDGLAGDLTGGAAWVLLTFLVFFGAGNVLSGAGVLDPHPHLGSRRKAWAAAGASRSQLRILDEAHRLHAINPPVGYGDRRTLINPLADAYAIFSSPAWAEDWLADRQLLIDPIDEAAEIIAFVHRVTGTLAEVREQIRVSVPGSPAQRTYQGYELALRRSVDEGLRRARALTAYRAELTRLEAVLDEQLALPAAEAFSDRVLDVLSETARQELATRQLDDSAAQLRALEAGLREITALLHEPAHLG